MYKDPTNFRKRVLAYKNGKMPYKNGRPIEDEEFESFRQTLPDNQKEPGDYRTRRYWELNDKPKTFGEAIGRGMYNLGDSGKYGQYGIEIPGWHANSVAYDKVTGNYEFMKPNTHSTRWMEDVYGYWGSDMQDFRENYKLQKGPVYDKYVPKKNVYKLPKFEDGTEPNLFQRSDKSYFYQNGDQEVDVFPLISPTGTSPDTWTFVDNSGKIYTPRQQYQPDQGEIVQGVDKNAGQRFWDNYIGELKYNLNNDRVIGGKYTLPAIGLGALGMYAAGAAGGGAMAPTLSQSVNLVGKNIWGNAARDFALSMLGGETINEASKLTTGQSWGQNISNATGGWVPTTVGDFTNPGYLLSGDAGNVAYNSAKEVVQRFPKQIRYLKKQITAENRSKTLAEKLQEFYGKQEAFYKQKIRDVQKELNEAKNESYEINDDYYNTLDRYTRDFRAQAAGNAEAALDGVIHWMDPLLTRLKTDPERKTASAADALSRFVDDGYVRIPDFSKMSGADIVRFINKNAPKKPTFNLTKGRAEKITSIPGLDAFINMNVGTGQIGGDGEIAMRMLLDNGGYTVTPQGNILSQKDVIPFDQIFKIGDFSIPKFGTTQVVDGTLSIKNPGTNTEINPFDIIRSISDKKIVPRQIDNGATQYSAQIPESLGDVLQYNIEYLKKMFPGAKPFGSSTTSAYAGTPHVTHDIDLLLSDTDFVSQVEKKFGGRAGDGWSVSSKPNGTGFEDTYTHSLGSQYGDAGNIDFNIIYTDPNTGMASSTMGTRALELYKQFFPSEYKQAVMQSMRTGQPIVINKTPKELIDAYDPVVKTITDSFSSSKAKHIPRAEAHLTTTDPDYVERALDLYAQEKLGGQAQRIPTTRDMFTDVEQNRRIFDELGYKGVDKETVVKDPAKMKNLVDYWYYHNSIFGRGVSSGNIPYSIGTADYTKTVDDAFRVWKGIGGNANGPGLNTVTLGDSKYGDVYGYIQPKLNFDGSQSAEELIQSAKRQLGHYSYQFTDAEKQQIEKILNKYGQSISGKPVNTPGDLLDTMNSDTYSSKQALQEISDQLGIRALSKQSLFGTDGGRYNSMTGDVTSKDAVMYAPRSTQEMPVSDVVRDRQTAQQDSRSEDELKSEVMQLAEQRWNQLREILFKQNRLYRKRKEFEPLKVGWKYDNMTNEDFKKYADIKIARENPTLSQKKKQLDKHIDDLEEQNSSNLDVVRNAERKLKKVNELRSKAQSINWRKKRLLQNLTAAGVLASPIIGVGAIVYNNQQFNNDFFKSDEYSQFLNDPRTKKALDSDDDSYEKIFREYKHKYKKRIRSRLKKTMIKVNNTYAE